MIHLQRAVIQQTLNIHPMVGQRVHIYPTIIWTLYVFAEPSARAESNDVELTHNR